MGNALLSMGNANPRYIIERDSPKPQLRPNDISSPLDSASCNRFGYLLHRPQQSAIHELFIVTL